MGETGAKDPIIKEFISKAKKSYKLGSAYLFGSRARGDNFKSSDYDVILVSDDFSGKFFTNRMSEVYEKCGVNFDLEVLCYTKKEFEKMSKGINIVSAALKYAVRIA